MNFQTRAIVGDRHFVLMDESNAEEWVIPGQSWQDGINGRKFEKPRTVTTEQLRNWATKNGKSLRIDRVIIYRRDANE